MSVSKTAHSPKGYALMADMVVASPMVVRSRVASKLGDMAKGASDYLSEDYCDEHTRVIICVLHILDIVIRTFSITT
jgi:hypothetical protein